MSETVRPAMSDDSAKSHRGSAIRSVVLGISSLFLWGLSSALLSLISTVTTILGLLTLVVGILLGFDAIRVSIAARKGMEESNGYDGKGFARAGMVMGILGIALPILPFVTLLLINGWALIKSYFLGNLQDLQNGANNAAQ